MPEERVPHDQAFKQLLADFTLESLAFFAGDEGRRLTPGAEVTLLRQEQISARLGHGHREVDFLVLLEWPDGEQEAIAFLAEEEANPTREAAYKVAEYVLLVGRWLEKDRQLSRIVPVVVFVGDGHVRTSISIGTDLRTYLSFDCVTCHLAELDAQDALRTGNLAAAANVMNMRYPAEQKVALCAAAMVLWRRRVPSDDTVAKFAQYIARCARLTEEQDVELEQALVREEGEAMLTIFDRKEEKGRVRGLEEGRVQGRAASVLDILDARGIALTPAERERVTACTDLDRLRDWLLRAGTVTSAAELFADH